MPRIKAATVPEHREVQREAILNAAAEVIVERGLQGLRFTEVADRAGVARPSVYDYFRSKNDLLVALVDSLFPPWRDEVEAALEGASSPKARIEAFVRAQLRLASEGRHELPFALAQGALDPKVQARVAAAHQGIAELLMSALNEMKVPDAETGLGLVTGVVRTAIDGLSRGGSPSEMTDAAVAFAVAGVEGLASQARRTPKRRAGSRRRKGAT